MKAMALVIGMACGAAWAQDVIPVARAERSGIARKELAGGLIVEDLKLGDGYEVKAGGAVVVQYTATLAADPTKVVGASCCGGPAAVQLASALPGWERGVPGMRVGGVRRLTVPASMTKGTAGVPKDADLVYEIELLDALRIEEVKVGEGAPAATPQSVAFTAFSITDKEGKVVEQHSARDLFFWVPGEYRAMEMCLAGMKVGGKRKVHIPAAFNAASPRFGSSRPANVPVTIEVELISVRNLAPAMPSIDEGC